MELNNKTLVEWLRDAPDEKYPQGKKVDHYTHYAKLSEYLKTNVHDEVTVGANLKDPEIVLNDHGPKHIETVISRASYMVSQANCSLGPYEVYILLCCIELHDVGNIFGRYKHEVNATIIMQEAEGICGRDQIEAIKIRQIAEAHGGKTTSGDKDKISGLPEKDDTFFGDLRPQLIASILRFADELADDKDRAHRKLLINGLLPKKSEVFHAYAMCLDSVKVNHEDSGINLSFHIPKKFLSRKFGKMGEEVYLLDEVYNRVLKMHFERIYCMRFCKNVIDLQRLFVRISFYEETLVEVFPRISFELSEKGYPDVDSDIFDMCDELSINGQRITGEYVKSEVDKQ